MRTHSLVAIILVAAVAACGSNRTERGLSGAAIGAAVGTAGAYITQNDLGPAAVGGALVGAVVGAATDPQDIDLGDPIW
jgi:hypothetical protein